MIKKIEALLRKVKDKDRINEMGIFQPYFPLFVSGTPTKEGYEIWSMTNLEIEEFAELIIQECARVAKYSSTHECWNGIDGAILNHFGVDNNE